MAQWVQVTGTLKQVAVGSAAHIWGVQFPGNAIYRFTGNTWEQIPEAAVQIDTASDGTTYCIDASNVLFRRESDKWVEAGRGIKHVGVGSADHVWAVSTAGKALRRVNGQFQEVGNTTLLSLSVGVDGAVWGVNSAGNIYRFNGRDFEQIKGTLHQISVGSANAVWGVQTGGLVWRYTTTTRNPDDAPFDEVKGQKLGQVSVGADGLVWGTNGGAIYYYLPDAPVAVSNFRMMEDYFQPGEEADFAFDITNTAFGTTLTGIKLQLLFDTALFKAKELSPKTPTIDIAEPLPFGIVKRVDFKLVASDKTPPGKYAMHGVKTAATVNFNPGLAPLESVNGGWMAFVVGKD